MSQENRKRVSQRDLCKIFGHSRQGYYGQRKLQIRREEQSEHILGIVREVRFRQPRCGCRKMHDHVNKELLLRGIEPIGRDRFLDVLRERQLLVRPLKRFCRTTNSYHRFRTHKNLLKKVLVTGFNQAWVSDITYIRTRTGFCYLFLITDYYSRKIVGYSLRTDLSVAGALQALRMAIRQAKGKEGIIHHSDRGIQYCCDAYAEELSNHKMVVSMTEENHCYENAVAERVNETLKYDLMLGEVFSSYYQAMKATKQAVQIYNEERWHQALDYATPAMKHAA